MNYNTGWVWVGITRKGACNVASIQHLHARILWRRTNVEIQNQISKCRRCHLSSPAFLHILCSNTLTGAVLLGGYRFRPEHRDQMMIAHFRWAEQPLPPFRIVRSMANRFYHFNLQKMDCHEDCARPTRTPSCWSWRRSFTLTSTCAVRGGLRSPPVWTWPSGRWKCGSRTVAWSTSGRPRRRRMTRTRWRTD